VKVELPAVVGVPDSTPAELSVRPAGREPEFTDQVYGVVPPVAVRVTEYGTPTVPAGGAEKFVVTPVPMVSVVASVAICPRASVTLAVKLNVPVAVGVPVSTPLAFRVIPAGRLPEATDQVYGLVPPVTVRVWV
jgi:hypothetical protein